MHWSHVDLLNFWVVAFVRFGRDRPLLVLWGLRQLPLGLPVPEAEGASAEGHQDQEQQQQDEAAQHDEDNGPGHPDRLMWKLYDEKYFRTFGQRNRRHLTAPKVETEDESRTLRVTVGAQSETTSVQFCCMAVAVGSSSRYWTEAQLKA